MLAPANENAPTVSREEGKPHFPPNVSICVAFGYGSGFLGVMSDRVNPNLEGALAEFVASGSDEAFRRIVDAYLPLVTGTAIRRTGGRRDLADDIAQTVFVDLARQAKSMPSDVRLAGWLHRHTIFVSTKVMRGERRREKRERLASTTPIDGSSPAGDLEGLDDLLLSLGEQSRQAVLMRFVEGRTHDEVGEALGITRAAAQKRIERALAHLRASLGAGATAAGWAAALTPPVARGEDFARRISEKVAAAGRTMPISGPIGSWSGALLGAAAGLTLAAIPLTMAWRDLSLARAEDTSRPAGVARSAHPPGQLVRDLDDNSATAITVDEFVPAVLALPERYGFSEMAAARATTLARALPPESIQAAITALSARLPENHRLAHQWPLHVFSTLCARWAPRGLPNDFLAVWHALPSSAQARGSCLRDLATACARFDLGVTRDLIHSLRASNLEPAWSKQDRQNVVSSLTEAAIGEALRRDPPAAMAMMADLLAEPERANSFQPDDLQAGLELLGKSAEDPSMRGSLVDALAAVTDPRARAILEPPLMKHRPLSEWQRFVEAVPDVGRRGVSATAATAAGLSSPGPSKPDRATLLAWWEAQVPPAQRPAHAHELARTWPLDAYAELLAWVSRLGETEGDATFDRLRAAAAEKLAPREGDAPDPPRPLAPALALRIVDPDLRTAVLASVMRAWNGAEADEWTSENLPPEVAADLSAIANPSW